MTVFAPKYSTLRKYSTEIQNGSHKKTKSRCARRGGGWLVPARSFFLGRRWLDPLPPGVVQKGGAIGQRGGGAGASLWAPRRHHVLRGRAVRIGSPPPRGPLPPGTGPASAAAGPVGDYYPWKPRERSLFHQIAFYCIHLESLDPRYRYFSMAMRKCKKTGSQQETDVCILCSSSSFLRAPHNVCECCCSECRLMILAEVFFDSKISGEVIFIAVPYLFILCVILISLFGVYLFNAIQQEDTPPLF